ncbi:MAG TPA: SigB/SigF/SigG family RNA polymerase sigma factor [Nocardioides sp.]|nr:SigB/SigF/SigG family RNA polymerase sigma factor [Nocardioides sp.]
MAEDPSLRAQLEDEVIRLNMVVAREVARRYEGRGVAADDLRQVAYMGLVKAVRNYDPEKATDFLSFAVPTIRGEVRRWFRDAGWMVRPPRSVQELQARIVGAQDELWQVLGRAPRPTELAAHLDEDLDRVIDALSANGCFTATSLDAPGRSSDDSAAAIGDGMGAAEPGYATVDARVALKPLLENLTPRERLILEMRFFRGATQAEIGNEIGVTQMQVSRLLSGIFDRLRVSLADGEPVRQDSVTGAA